MVNPSIQYVKSNANSPFLLQSIKWADSTLDYSLSGFKAMSPILGEDNSNIWSKWAEANYIPSGDLTSKVGCTSNDCDSTNDSKKAMEYWYKYNDKTKEKNGSANANPAGNIFSNRPKD